MIVFKTLRTVISYLVGAKLQPLDSWIGSKRFDKNVCEASQNIDHSNAFAITVTKET